MLKYNVLPHDDCNGLSRFDRKRYLLWREIRCVYAAPMDAMREYGLDV